MDSGENNPGARIENANTSSESDEIQNLKSARDRALAAGLEDVASALNQKIENFYKPKEEVKSISEEQEKNAPAFIGIDKEGSAEDKQRYEEVMALADELFDVKTDDEGNFVDLVVNENADKKAIFESFDNWYDKYQESFPEPESTKVPIEEAREKYLQLLALLPRIKAAVGELEGASDILKEIDVILSKGPEGLSQSDIGEIESLISRSQRLAPSKEKDIQL